MIIDVLYDLSVALADPDVELDDVLQDWRGRDDVSPPDPDLLASTLRSSERYGDDDQTSGEEGREKGTPHGNESR